MLMKVYVLEHPQRQVAVFDKTIFAVGLDQQRRIMPGV